MNRLNATIEEFAADPASR